MTLSFLDRMLSLLALLVTLVVHAEATVPSSSAARSTSNVRQRSHAPRGRTLLCLGIFRDCDDDEADLTNSTSDDEFVFSDEGTFNGTDDLCLGLFRSCNDSDTNSTTNCSEATGGIFGGRPLFGECGTISEWLYGGSDGAGGILNRTDTDGDGDFDSFAINVDQNSSDTDRFQRDDNPSFSLSFLDEWSDSAKTTNKTCAPADSAPVCLDPSEEIGFWVCRTLSDPYTGAPSSKTLCIGAGSFLESNDACGCCAAPQEEDASNNTSAAVCPEPCPCTCDVEGTGDGVWIETTDTKAWMAEDATTLCVDPRWAVSATASVPQIVCLKECPNEDGN